MTRSLDCSLGTSISMATRVGDTLAAASNDANSAHASSLVSSAMAFVASSTSCGFSRKLMWARPTTSGRISARAIACSGVMAQSARWMRFSIAILGRYLQIKLAILQREKRCL